MQMTYDTSRFHIPISTSQKRIGMTIPNRIQINSNSIWQHALGLRTKQLKDFRL